MKLAGPAGNPESLPARAGQFLPNYPQIGSDTLRAGPSRECHQVALTARQSLPSRGPIQVRPPLNTLYDVPRQAHLKPSNPFPASLKRGSQPNRRTPQSPGPHAARLASSPDRTLAFRIPEGTRAPRPHARSFPGRQRACKPADDALDTLHSPDCDHVVRESAVQESRTC
jgi:hypothetical protein